MFMNTFQPSLNSKWPTPKAFFQNGRQCGPVLLNISLSKTDIGMLEAPMLTFLGSKNPMVTENVHEYGSAILKSKMATTESPLSKMSVNVVLFY